MNINSTMGVFLMFAVINLTITNAPVFIIMLCFVVGIISLALGAYVYHTDHKKEG